MVAVGWGGVTEDMAPQGAEPEPRDAPLQKGGAVTTRPSIPLKQIVYGRSHFFRGLSRLKSVIRYRQNNDKRDDIPFSRGLVSRKVTLSSFRVSPSRYSS